MPGGERGLSADGGPAGPWSVTHGRRFWVLVLAWWCAWRLPFWASWIDFFDSVQFHDRVARALSWGFQAPNAHLPLQSTVYGPAAVLHRALGESLRPETSITIISTLNGLAALVAAVHVWRRFFPVRAVQGAILLYPMMVGPGLADLTTYSMSAVHAFLWGGTALWAAGLAGEQDGRARWTNLLGALLLALAVYTHVMSAIWMTVPAVVVLHALSRMVALPSLERVSAWRHLFWTALLPALLFNVLFLLLEGWQASLVGLADGAADGVWKLLFRDAGGERWFQAQLRHVAVVTSGVGALMLPVAAWSWARNAGRWVWLGVLGLLLSALVCCYQFHWGFMGRLWLPVLLWAVPALASVLTLMRARLGNAAFGALVLQNLLTFVHVHGTRAFGEHPPVNERNHSGRWRDSADVHVVARRLAGFTLVEGPRAVSWEYDDDRGALDLAIQKARAQGGGVWVSSQALKVPYQLRDGHLVAVDNSAAPRGPTRLERHVLARGDALVLDAPTGRGEHLSQLVPAAEAPPLAARLTRALSVLTRSEALLVVVQPGPRFVEVHSKILADCVLREAYDAWDIEAWYAILRTGCRPVGTGTTDGTGVLMRPVPRRSGYRATRSFTDGTRVPGTLDLQAWVPLDGSTLDAWVAGLDARAGTVAVIRQADDGSLQVAVAGTVP
jgi:hypothetical protein